MFSFIFEELQNYTMPSECWAGETQNEGVALFFGGFKGFSRVPNLNYFLCSFCRVSLVFFFLLSTVKVGEFASERGKERNSGNTALFRNLQKQNKKKTRSDMWCRPCVDSLVLENEIPKKLWFVDGRKK